MLRRAAITLALLLLPSTAAASGFEDYGQDLRAEPESVFDAAGYFRTRGQALHNLDLDRGPTPSGELLYPVPQSDGAGQTLSFADMRLRSDMAAYWPSGGAAIKVRVDALDNLVLGSAPTGIPAASTTQDNSSGFITIKRAYAEILTPLGFIAVGRMGAHWGMGMLTNGGDCLDCDSGDSSDRITYILPTLDHLFVAAYDFSSTSPTLPHQTGTRAIAVEPSAMVHTLTFAAMHFTTPEGLLRRRQGGRFTFDYGAFASHRWQNNDLPAQYLPLAAPAAATIGGDQLMFRGYAATAADLWLRFVGPDVRLELEAAYIHATVDQPSLIPGVRLNDPAVSDQFGFAFQSDFGDPEDAFSAGLDAGIASGDPAPGFGAYPVAGQAAPQAGDFDGPQAIRPSTTGSTTSPFTPTSASTASSSARSWAGSPTPSTSVLTRASRSPRTTTAASTPSCGASSAEPWSRRAPPAANACSVSRSTPASSTPPVWASGRASTKARSSHSAASTTPTSASAPSRPSCGDYAFF